MISVAKVSFEKHDKDKLSPRVLELRQKIQDKNYLDFAVQRIAQVVSRKIVEEPDAFLLKTFFSTEDVGDGGYKGGTE